MPQEPDAIKPSRLKRGSDFTERVEYERLGQWLRRQREAQGLQQKPVSRKLDKHEQYVNRVEQGRQRIDLIQFLDLVQVLGINQETTLKELLQVLGHADGSGNRRHE